MSDVSLSNMRIQSLICFFNEKRKDFTELCISSGKSKNLDNVI